MLERSLLVVSACLLVGLAQSCPAAARAPAGTPNSHLLINPQGTKPASRDAAPGIRRTMPPRGFRDKPPGFAGGPLRHAPPPVRWTGGAAGHPGGPGHDLGLFRGHDFAHFTADERRAWQRGFWRRSYHRGHRGWWWVVGDAWYFYPAPIYPYPLYVGTLDYYDYEALYGTPRYYWYFCSDPEGYYPYIQECRRAWHPVPPVTE
ncbi:MAG TPA: hypothetical protein VG889_01785 [Rhizomicrobium sp.]|nr:hypothetical protein [Rhizomicrobium sp.]